MKKLLITAAVILTVVTGCSLNEACEGSGEGVYVRFDFAAAATKSSLDVDDMEIGDINLFAYYNGSLDNEVYISDLSEGVGITLRSGSSYNVYALVNTGDCEAPVSEEDLPSLRCTLSSIGSYSETGLPMVGVTQLTPSSVDGSVEIELTRLVSKVGFKVDADEIGGLSVTSVRVMQSALDVLPFADASAATTVSDGDYASESDIAMINAGGTASFYVLENCQGVLLPDNTDPWAKVPDNISDQAGLCTYIEVGAELDGSYGVSGSAIYRFFLGQDATTDFNVIRNTSSTVTLKTTVDGLGQISWKIDPDVTFKEISYSLDAADYIGQWGSITFPEATEDHPVTVSLGSESITIPSSNSLYIGNLGDDDPDLLVYTGSSSNTVYLCQGQSSVELDLAQDLVSKTIPVEVSDDIGWAVAHDSGGILAPGANITVNEDGSDCGLRLYLWDNVNKKALSANLFSMPAAVMAVVTKGREATHVNSHLYWYFDLDLTTGNDSMADVTAWNQHLSATEDEEYLFESKLYGVEADGGNPASTVLNCFQNLAGKDTEYAITVNPAFPDQRHLGEVYNYEFALDDLQSDSATLPLYQTCSGTTKASWKLARGSEWAEGDNEKDFETLIENKNDKVLVSIAVSSTELNFTFPTPDDAADYPFVGGGTYHIRGTVTNPHTNREIRGDYSADVVLYLVVGAEARIYEDDDITYMDISYLPAVSRCGETVDETFRDVWNLKCKWIEVLPHSGDYSTSAAALGTSVYTCPKVPDDVVHDVDNLDELYSNLVYYANNQLRDCGTDFKFYNRYTGDTGEEMRMEESGVIVEAYRLQDIESGVYFVEEYFGSFDSY